MLSEKGNEVLRSLYNDFRDNFLEVRPMSNENDVERAFLKKVQKSTYPPSGSDAHWLKIDEQIENIR